MPRKYASWLPCDLVVELQHNPKSLKEMYYPQPFVATGGKRALDNRLGVAFNYTAGSSNSPTERKRGIGMGMARFHSWSQWSERRTAT